MLSTDGTHPQSELGRGTGLRSNHSGFRWANVIFLAAVKALPVLIDRCNTRFDFDFDLCKNFACRPDEAMLDSPDARLFPPGEPDGTPRLPLACVEDIIVGCVQ